MREASKAGRPTGTDPALSICELTGLRGLRLLLVLMCNLNPVRFNQEEFEEVRRGVFFYPKSKREFDWDTPIYRYVDFEYFLPIMEGILYVPTRTMFKDLHEQGQHYNPFIYCLKPVGDNEVDYRDIFNNEKVKRENSRNWLTLCFTLSSPDNYFFWRTYTTKGYGVCFKTTLGRLLDSIVMNDYDVYVGKMYYSDTEYSGHNINGYAYGKTAAYKDENELRLYFMPKDGGVKNSEIFEIDAQNMISEIILSPFVNGNVRKYVMKLFRECFSTYAPIIHWSKIIEKI